MIRLIIRARSYKAAEKALAAHGITYYMGAKRDLSLHEVTATCLDADEAKVRAWFDETPEQPLQPIGALLHFSKED